ncbi:YeeE/YedE thiosulfate transporter family protein, partial [Guyparkeria sp.]
MTLATVDNPWLLILAGALGIGLLFGLVAAATRYCNMGAVSDWVLTGDMGRMRAWLLSIAVAIAAVGAFELLGAIDLDQTRVNYRAADFPWLRYLLGGTMFGIGMVLAGGCTTKTLVNIGQGDLKSLWAYAVVGLTALVLLNWPTARLFIDQGLAWPGLSLASLGIDHQDAGGIAAGITSLDHAYLRPVMASLLATGLFVWLWRLDHARRMRPADLAGGIGIGMIIVLGWLWTGSSTGQALMNEAALAFDPPRGTGTQSLSFVGPAAESLRLAADPKL